MPQKKYLFINKDASSDHLSRSKTSTQRGAIQKHVQKGLAHNWPQKPTKCVQNQAEEVELEHKSLLNPSACNLSCKFDVFNTAPIHIDRTVLGLLEYFINSYCPMMYNYDHFAPPSVLSATHTVAARKLRAAMQGPLEMNCMLSAVAARITYIDGFSFPGPIERQHSFMQDALFLMQDRIRGTASETVGDYDRLVSCMVYLCGGEAHRGNLSAAWTHLRTLRNIADNAGGLRALRDNDVFEHVLMADVGMSAMDLEPCLFPCDFDPGPVSTLDLTAEEFPLMQAEALGVTLLRKDTDILPVKLKSLACAVIESYLVRKHVNIGDMSEHRAFEVARWLRIRNLALRNKLCSITNLDRKAHAIRAALIMWSAITTTLFARTWTVQKMAMKLRSMLDDIPDGQWSESDNNNEDLRLWILLLGQACAAGGSETLAWFSNEVRRILRSEDAIVTSKTETDGLLNALIVFQKGFLYDDNVQFSRLEKLIWTDYDFDANE